MPVKKNDLCKGPYEIPSNKKLLTHRVPFKLLHNAWKQKISRELGEMTSSLKAPINNARQKTLFRV